MNRIFILVILAVVVFLMDIYVFRTFRYFLSNSGSVAKTAFFISWWLISALSFMMIFVYRDLPRTLQLVALNVLVIIFITKVFAAIFILIGDGAMLIKQNLPNASFSVEENRLSRRKFVARLGLLAAAVPFVLMFNGLFRTAYNFHVRRVRIAFPNLPKAFSGLKVVQLSDIHTGSFIRGGRMDHAMQLVLDEKPDLILFTGDLVNNRTDEAYKFIESLSRLKAPMGVYSTLGNHDYGDYETWPDEASKRKNLEDMIRLHKDLGWTLMNNTNRVFEREGQKIALLGVENWGAALHFPKYGKIDEAKKGTEEIPFKLLMSHDPSHWDAEINKAHKDIDLMMAGHTHGFQFGVEIPGFKWSPSQYVYKQWSGLHQQGSQYLYVNRGLGCLGYSGRIGIRPEITVFELVTA